MSKITSFAWRWGPALLIMVAIFGFSSIPSTQMPNFGLVDLIVKKGGHALGYGLLALSYLRGLKGDGNQVYPRWLFAAWLLATLYSVTDEFHQSFVPGRHPVVTDMLIDSVGAALALIFMSRYDRRSQPPMRTDN